MAYSLDQLQAEANVSPFEYTLCDGREISIPPPSGEAMMVIGETPVNESRKMLRLLLGEHYDEVWTELGPKPGAYTVLLVNKLVTHFGVGEAQKSPGGSRALPR